MKNMGQQTFVNQLPAFRFFIKIYLNLSIQKNCLILSWLVSCWLKLLIWDQLCNQKPNEIRSSVNLKNIVICWLFIKCDNCYLTNTLR